MGVYIKGMEMPTLYRTYKVRFSESGDGKIIVGIANEDSTAYRPIGEVIPVPPHGRLIEEADAIETAWMILRGLGYRKEENPQLEQTVHEVFATAPTIEVE